MRSCTAMAKQIVVACTIIVLIVIGLGAVIPAMATTFWQDSFEPTTNLNGWSTELINSTIALTPQTAQQGVQSIQLLYNDLNACMNGNPCGPTIYRSYTQTTEVWSRFYYRLKSGFQASGSGTKILYYTNGLGQPYPTLWLGMNSDLKPHFTLQQPYFDSGNSYNLDQNVGTAVALATETWYCIETRVKDNTPGVQNASIEIYIDGVQKALYDRPLITPAGYQFQPQIAGSGHYYNYTNIYRERGIGSTFYDNVAFGDTRIGCETSADTTQPAAPTGLILK